MMLDLLAPPSWEPRQPLIGMRPDSSNPLADGLAGLWTMADGAGLKATDSSGHDRHGTLTNMDPATARARGPHGPALDFDGIDDYLALPTMSFPADFSCFVLFNPDKVGGVEDADKEPFFANADNQNWIRLQAANSVYVRFSNLSNPNIALSESFVVGRWQTFMLVRQNDVCTIYRNGRAVGNGARSGTFVCNTFGRKNIGGASENDFEGVAGSGMLWDRACLDNEAAKLHIDPLVLFRPARRIFPAAAAVGGTILPQMMQQGLYAGAS